MLSIWKYKCMLILVWKEMVLVHYTDRQQPPLLLSSGQSLAHLHVFHEAVWTCSLRLLSLFSFLSLNSDCPVPALQKSAHYVTLVLIPDSCLQKTQSFLRMRIRVLLPLSPSTDIDAEWYSTYTWQMITTFHRWYCAIYIMEGTAHQNVFLPSSDFYWQED